MAISLLLGFNGCLFGPEGRKEAGPKKAYFPLPSYSYLFAEKTSSSFPDLSVGDKCASTIERTAIKELSDSLKAVYLDKEIGACIFYGPPSLTPYDTSEINREDTVTFIDLGDSIQLVKDSTFNAPISGKISKYTFDSTFAIHYQDGTFKSDTLNLNCKRMTEIVEYLYAGQTFILLGGIGQLEYQYGFASGTGQQSSTKVKTKYMIYGSDTLDLSGEAEFK